MLNEIHDNIVFSVKRVIIQIDYYDPIGRYLNSGIFCLDFITKKKSRNMIGPLEVIIFR